jgi:hypothetical protein
MSLLPVWVAWLGGDATSLAVRSLAADSWGANSATVESGWPGFEVSEAEQAVSAAAAARGTKKRMGISPATRRI